MPTWAVRTHDLWSVTRDTWQRKSKNRILSKNQGYRCYIIRSNYKYKSYSILIYYTSKYTRTSTYPHTPSKIAVTCHVSRSQNCASISISRWISMVKTHRNQGRTSRASVPVKWEAIRKIKQIRREKRTCQVGGYFPRISIFQAWHVTCHAKKGKHMNESEGNMISQTCDNAKNNSEGVHASFQKSRGIEVLHYKK